MSCLLAGLAGNPGLIHCTVLAVSRIYFQFRDIFPEALTEQVGVYTSTSKSTSTSTSTSTSISISISISILVQPLP